MMVGKIEWYGGGEFLMVKIKIKSKRVFL